MCKRDLLRVAICSNVSGLAPKTSAWEGSGYVKVHLSDFRISSPQLKAAFTALAILIILVVSTYILSHKEVTLRIDGKTKSFVTRSSDVAAMLADADIKVSPHDEVEPALDAPIYSGAEVSIKRAVPIALDVNGMRKRFWTTADTAGEVIEGDLGMSLHADITLDPAADTKVGREDTVTLRLLNRRVERLEAEMPFATERRDDNRLTKGRTRIATKGQPGIKETVTEQVWAGNIQVETIVRSENVTAEPVTQIVSIGTLVPRVAAAPSIGNVSRGGRSVSMVATAYAAGTGGAGWRTATGTGVYKGIVAVDPRVIPLGTKLYIDGYGSAVAADTGGAIKGNRIDLGFGSAGEAIQFGRRTVTVHIQ